MLSTGLCVSWGPRGHTSSRPSSITGGKGGPKAPEGSVLRLSQGVTYQALPGTVGNQKTRADVGSAPGQPARRHPEPQPFPVMAGAHRSFLAYSYTVCFCELGRRPLFMLVLRPGTRPSQVIGAKMKQEAGSQWQATRFFPGPACPSHMWSCPWSKGWFRHGQAHCRYPVSPMLGIPVPRLLLGSLLRQSMLCLF